MAKSKYLEIISCGPGLPDINNIHGRSCDWAREIAKSKVSDIKTVNVYEGDMPSVDKDSMWIILGSRYSVYSDIDWIRLFKNRIRKGIDNGVSMLGICFGHQILCSVLGSRVVNNNKGWEIGSSIVSLTESGQKSRLFKDFNNKFSVYESHHDTVVGLPENIDVLAENDYGLQSFSYQGFVFGVQFHPEFSYDVMKAYYLARIDIINDSDKYSVNQLNEGIKVIDNFIDINLRR